MSNYIYYRSDSPKNIIMATSNYAYHQIYCIFYKTSITRDMLGSSIDILWNTHIS